MVHYVDVVIKEGAFQFDAVIAVEDRRHWYVDEVWHTGFDKQIEGELFAQIAAYLEGAARHKVEEEIEAYAVAQWEERDAMARDY
jgi:hypothetical protein